jgi:hypothetical protein
MTADRIRRVNWRAVVALVSLGVLVGGVAMASVPAALIVAGVLGFALAVADALIEQWGTAR